MPIRNILLLFLLILITSISCKDQQPFEGGYRFWIQNTTEKQIYFLVSHSYPDTTIPDELINLQLVEVSSKSPYDSDKRWEDVFNELPADTLSVFIFDRDTITYYDWQEVRYEYKILERFDISLDDLKNNSWTVTYP